MLWDNSKQNLWKGILESGTQLLYLTLKIELPLCLWIVNKKCFGESAFTSAIQNGFLYWKKCPGNSSSHQFGLILLIQVQRFLECVTGVEIFKILEWLQPITYVYILIHTVFNSRKGAKQHLMTDLMKAMHTSSVKIHCFFSLGLIFTFCRTLKFKIYFSWWWFVQFLKLADVRKCHWVDPLPLYLPIYRLSKPDWGFTMRRYFGNWY
jgi:hypothetical protein